MATFPGDLLVSVQQVAYALLREIFSLVHHRREKRQKEPRLLAGIAAARQLGLTEAPVSVMSGFPSRRETEIRTGDRCRWICECIVLAPPQYEDSRLLMVCRRRGVSSLRCSIRRGETPTTDVGTGPNHNGHSLVRTRNRRRAAAASSHAA